MADSKRVLATVLTGLAVAGCGDGRLSAELRAPTIELLSAPTALVSGNVTRVKWSTTGATGCVASGAWTGRVDTAGAQSTGPLFATMNVLALRCSGPGGTSHAAVVVKAEQGREAGLDFPGVDAAGGTVRFRFTRPLEIYPATYIWRVNVRSQPNYYTTFFWGNDGPFQWDSEGFLWWKRPTSNTYYGAHPYPYPAPNYAPAGKVGPRYWEIAVNGLDVLSESEVEYDRWHTQVLRVWGNATGKHHEFYWDLPDTSRVVKHVEQPSYGNRPPPSPALTWGDAPWAPTKEVMKGVIRGIQIYSAALPMTEILKEASAPLSTDTGRTSVWYLNLDPTPADISDKSGAGNDPEWVGPERPGLWSSEE